MDLTAALIHALPLAERRVFNRAEAASYVGISPGHFDKLVTAGILPDRLPFGNIRRWDKAALDRFLDTAGTLPTDQRPAGESAYETWSRSRGQG
jgi:predicted DNA-binding transcriptional regulator AlpA